jgi:hypothetical protein
MSIDQLATTKRIFGIIDHKIKKIKIDIKIDILI